MFFEKTLTKNKEHHLKISDYFDYGKPSTNTIEIIWNGDNEDEKKFLKIYKIVVNNQHILPHTSMITPIQNEYIKNLLSTEEGTKFYRKKISLNSNKNFPPTPKTSSIHYSYHKLAVTCRAKTR